MQVKSKEELEMPDTLISKELNFEVCLQYGNPWLEILYNKGLSYYFLSTLFPRKINCRACENELF